MCNGCRPGATGVAQSVRGATGVAQSVGGATGVAQSMGWATGVAQSVGGPRAWRKAWGATGMHASGRSSMIPCRGSARFDWCTYRVDPLDSP